MAAVLVSSKTLAGRSPSAGWETRYPSVWSANSIWECAQGTQLLWKVVHYNGDSAHYALDLIAIMQRIPLTEAIQLNMFRPELVELQYFRAVYPGVEIILQIGRKVLDELGRSDNLAAYLETYGGLVDYVLLDPSGGTGQSFDAIEMEYLLGGVDWSRLGMLPGLAGGLDAHNLDRLRPILERWPDLGWDAEGRLMGARGLAVEPTLAYFKASLDLLQSI